MQLLSSAFDNNDTIPLDYTCDGEGMSPLLTIIDIPEGTESLALIVTDPDVLSGTFTHWVIWNIDPETEEIEEGETPAGAEQGINSSGGVGYTPPCPPTGVHHYIFTLYALDSELDLPANTDKEGLEEEMAGSILDQSQLVGLYGKVEEEDLQEEHVGGY